MSKPEGPLSPPIPEGGPDPPASQAPPVPQVPHAPQILQTPQKSVLHMPPLNCLTLCPNFLENQMKMQLCIYLDKCWMDTHRFQDNDKVQRFCLTLTGEARLWYKSLRLINADWIGTTKLI